ncbi:unnamed protein product [Rotaria magnacalcarata]|uniref:Uncharacterized protein n=3 Tax=Rotaria magnacalcarata TaxID=392030 RepID=A0A815PMM3_9BILA|nr:unnamed protein product [Rotaria magnacalcarata]CAF1637671.1 unnamed protein product [Rotaria magnacalcarata]CAF2090764.1 unnamed protein product [Rotaria magnacalcarata]CAF3894696.1 unnamed protein product [Rotaria magnacalcarata]CAF4681208.1 unnamed protein product [Rotaria magnacalcarata]
MYKDAGYGENWQPTANNNARRIDPYTHSFAVLGCFFAVGFVLIIIVVLSLIPLYISHSSATRSYVQVPRVSVNGYTLKFRSPWTNFDTDTILSESSNREALQAALTSMIQNDSALAGSIVEISSSSALLKRKRRLASNIISLSVNMYVISCKSCPSIQCLNQFQINTNNQLTDKSRTPTVRYELNTTNDTSSSSSTTQVYWLTYQLPNAVISNVSLVSADLKLISSSLENLINLDKTLNQPSTNNTITSTTAFPG